MALNLNSFMVGSDQPKVLVEFYTKVFGKPGDMVDETGAGWQIGACFFGVGEHSEVSGKSKEPSRMILNLETNEIEEEFNRIKDTRASVIKEPYEMEGAGGMMIATFADPDGNYFQLMTPWEGGK